MLSKLNTTYLLRNVQQTFCLIRSSTSYAANRPSEVKFDSVSDAYGYKSKGELFRGWFVFKLCSYTSLVNQLNQIFNVLRGVLGRRAFGNIMRSTLYGHFVAGTDKNDLKPIVERLHRHGVKIILDYSMEADIGNHQVQKNDDDVYNENMMKSLRNVRTAAELCGTSAITAMKVTAFVHPNILQKLNEILEQDKTSATTPILDVISKNSTLLTENEIDQMKHLIQRVHRIVQEVEKLEGKIFVDAEQTYFQTAIHRLVLELQEKFNRERVIVYNTYQCYRKTTLDQLRKDLVRSKDHHFHIGCKIVRGAYMDQERKRAIETNTEDPIHPNFDATTQCYHRVFVEIVEHAKKNGRTRLIVASHNEETVQFALETMKSMDIQRNDQLVSFATLFGMCDYLTFPLAAVGYNAYKLAPYGPIDCLLPYLTRRAQENRAIFFKAEKDRRLHYQALKARL